MYYGIAAYSVFAAQRLYYDIATYSVYDSVGSSCPAPNAYRATLHAVLFV